jgi:hypothetical protein
MNLIQNLSIFTVIIFLGITACKKKKANRYPDDGLPAISSTGENVFACHRDGIPWISSVGRPDMQGTYHDDSVIGLARFIQQIQQNKFV